MELQGQQLRTVIDEQGFMATRWASGKEAVEAVKLLAL